MVPPSAQIQAVNRGLTTCPQTPTLSAVHTEPHQFAPHASPNTLARGLAKGGVRALLFGLPLGVLLALVDLPTGIAFVCATWILLPLAVLSERLSPGRLMVVGALLGVLQLSGAWLQSTYLEAISLGLTPSEANDDVLYQALAIARLLPKSPWQLTFGVGFVGLWGVALAAAHAAHGARPIRLHPLHFLAKPAPSQLTLDILAKPAVVGLPLLGLAAAATTYALEPPDTLETAFFVGVGMTLAVGSYLLSAAYMAAGLLGFSNNTVERWLLGPDPKPPRPDSAGQEPAPPAPLGPDRLVEPELLSRPDSCGASVGEGDAVEA